MTNDLRTRLLALLEGTTPGPWKFTPWHVAEGPSSVHAPEGWLICETSSDANARLIAEAPEAIREAVAALDERDELLREVREWTRNGACADRTLSLMSRIDALLANTPPTPDPRDERIKALEALLVEADLEFRALGEGYTIRKRIDTLLNPTPVKE